MNYMNVLSDFEIRLKKCNPETPEQDQIFKLDSQLREKDIIIDEQKMQIEEMTRKVSNIKAGFKPTLKKETKAPALKKTKAEIKIPLKKTSQISDKKPVKKKTGKTAKEKSASSKKITPIKSDGISKRSKR
jgi:hypothetical protein